MKMISREIRLNKCFGNLNVLTLNKLQSFLDRCLNLKDSRPTSSYRFFVHGVSLIGPDVARVALYCMLSIF